MIDNLERHAKNLVWYDKAKELLKSILGEDKSASPQF